MKRPAMYITLGSTIVFLAHVQNIGRGPANTYVLELTSGREFNISAAQQKTILPECVAYWQQFTPLGLGAGGPANTAAPPRATRTRTRGANKTHAAGAE